MIGSTHAVWENCDRAVKYDHVFLDEKRLRRLRAKVFNYKLYSPCPIFKKLPLHGKPHSNLSAPGASLPMASNCAGNICGVAIPEIRKIMRGDFGDRSQEADFAIFASLVTAPGACFPWSWKKPPVRRVLIFKSPPS